MRSSSAKAISMIWLLGTTLLTANAVLFQRLISAILAIASAIMTLTFALWSMGGEQP